MASYTDTITRQILSLCHGDIKAAIVALENEAYLQRMGIDIAAAKEARARLLARLSQAMCTNRGR